jgi:molecular chaperone DnaK
VPTPGIEVTSAWTAVGIDLGTTHSVLSLVNSVMDHPRSLSFDDSCLVPSLLQRDLSTGQLVAGKKAETLESPIRSTKRYMGQVGVEFPTTGGAPISPVDAATALLSYLATHPEVQESKAESGEVWSVITVPAHFGDAARQATLDAANAAGLKVLRIINEPTAAALAYSMLPDVRNEEHEILAVYDLGGGTFDVTLLERKGLTFNVLSSEGDLKLGGDDFNDRLVEHLAGKCFPKVDIGKKGFWQSPLYHSLWAEAEHAKRALQESMECQIKTKFGHEAKQIVLDVTLERHEFESLITPEIERTLALMDRAILAARKRNKDLTRVLLVGGSTRLLLVEKMLIAHFPNAKIDGRLEPDLAVSWGASLQASLLLGIRMDTILVDVCSHSLGIGVAEDGRTLQENFRRACKHFGVLPNVPEHAIGKALGEKTKDFHVYLQGLLRVASIIHRNSPLPARRSEFFSTLYDDQEAVQVLVTQGEGETVGQNRVIGSFLFHLKPPAPAGTKCEIQLTYDVNGMIQVMAKQHGANHSALARFNSTTGEVLDWVQVDDSLGDPQSSDPENSEPETSEDENSESKTSELKISRGGNSATQSPAPKSILAAIANTPVDNLLLRRMKKKIGMVVDLEARAAGIKLAEEYALALQNSLADIDVEEHLEELEIQIQNWLAEVKV